MEYLNWEFTILGRAVAYSNLSTAAANIGVSQPQISRIISKIEKDLGVVLLDRDAKRKSSWTPVAYNLAQIYGERERQFRQDVQRIIGQSEPEHFRVASLDGLISLAVEFCNRLMGISKIEVMEHNIHDLSNLEARFLAGDYDLIFTSRSPGKKKFLNQKLLGYQSLDLGGTKADLSVLSSFEFSSQHLGKKSKGSQRFYVSNSLPARSYWMAHFAGQGTQPSKVRDKKPTKDAESVWAIGQDTLSSELWNKITKSL